MLGIGIITWRRPEFVIGTVIPKILAHTKGDFSLAISCNDPRLLGLAVNFPEIRLLGNGKNLGVAGGKNRVICWALNHKLEHLFLFEDDTFPIQDGWDIWYREAHRATGVQAVTYQPDDFYQGVSSHGPRGKIGFPGMNEREVEAVGTTLDGMMMLSATRKALETIGGFHRAFEGINGQEHSEWMTRAKKAGLCPFTNCSFLGCQEWVDGIDYQEWRWGKGIPSGRQRPEGDPQSGKLFNYEPGRNVFFRLCKTHRQGELWQDPCWDEATAKEVTL
jgi:hypothetical protein